MMTVAALGFTAAACSLGSSGSGSSSTATTHHLGANIGKRGVVTIRMAMVGDPGNPSVGVIQTFGGPKGKFVDPPKGTGIYKTCADAPKAPPPCLTVGKVNYTFGIGEFETTVSQYVTFLNTVDPRGKNLHQLYIDHMNPDGVAAVRLGQLLIQRRDQSALLGGLPRVGPEAVQLRHLPASGPVCQLTVQRHRALQDSVDVRRVQVRHLQGAPVAARPSRACTT